MKKSVFIFVIVIILLLMALIVVKCVQDGIDEPEQYQDRQPVVSSGEKTSVTVYYLTADRLYLLPLSMDIPATTEAAKVAMEKLLAGPPVPDAVDVFSNDTKLVNLFSIYDTVYIELTADFLLMTDKEITDAVRAIAATVMPLTNCAKFEILVEGERLPADLQLYGKSLSEPIPYYPAVNLSAADQELLLEGGLALDELVPVFYYLPESSGKYLVPFTTLVETSEQLTVEAKAEAAVRAMLTPPVEGGLYLLPTTNINFQGVQVDNGVAYCDFDQTILDSYGQLIEDLLLKCLVQTLTAQEGIDSVQITVNGEQPSQTASGVDISHPLTAAASINQVQVNK